MNTRTLLEVKIYLPEDCYDFWAAEATGKGHTISEHLSALINQSVHLVEAHTKYKINENS
mgnify:CR=1 FL=1